MIKNAPIMPNKSLGGFDLRLPLSSIQQSVIGLGLYIEGNSTLVHPFEARYMLGKGEVSICVDVRNGKVFKLIASTGYIGGLENRIFVGMNVGDAMRCEPNLYYDEAEESIFWRGLPGVSINVADTDPDVLLIPEMNITTITVYAVEIDTHDGQAGHW